MDLLRHLEYFVAVAEHRHFGRAAASLGVTQPPVSQGLRRLENHLGVRLVDRSAAGATLTESGAALLPRARLVVGDAARLVDEAQKSSAGPGHVAWGAIATVDDELVARCAAALGGSAKTVDFVTADTVALVEAVRRRTLDVAIVDHPALLDGVRSSPIVTLRRSVVVPAGHRAATAADPRVAMLTGLDLATGPRSHNPPAHDLLVDGLRRQGLDPAVVPVGSYREMCAAVAAGGCFGLATPTAPVLTGTSHVRLLVAEVALRLRIVSSDDGAAAAVRALDRVLIRESR